MVKKKKVTPRKKKKTGNKNVIGDVHYVPVVHVVPNEDLKKYKKEKGSMKNRPVAIVKKNRDSTVEVAKITSKKPSKKQNIRGYRSRLATTKMSKESWISTENIAKSYHTGKNFKSGEVPLNKKRSTRVTTKDLNTRKLKKKRKEKKSSRR